MATTPAAHSGARRYAWAGFALGSLVSVAGNWLHAWLPATDHGPDWAPSLGSQIGAAVWPVALLVAVEVLSRTPWPGGKAWMLVRFGGAAVVALGSGVISYGHIHSVLTAWGYDRLGAGVGPLVIDGLMLISGFALLAMGHAAPTKQTDREAPAPPVAKRAPSPVKPPAASQTDVLPPATEPTSRPVPPTAPARREAPARVTEPSREAGRWEALAAALPKDSTDEQVWEAIRAYREESEDRQTLPTVNLVKTRMGVGTSRASRLLRDVDTPTALHAVREATA